MNKSNYNKRSGLFKAWNTAINRFYLTTLYISYLFSFYYHYYKISRGGDLKGDY